MRLPGGRHDCSTVDDAEVTAMPASAVQGRQDAGRRWPSPGPRQLLLAVGCLCLWPPWPPARAAPSYRDRDFVSPDMIKYLMAYGYMQKVDLNLPFLRSQDELRNAIKLMQAYSGLPVTGRVNRETEAVLHRPRCGQPDIDPEHHPSRAKRHHHGEAPDGPRRRARRYTVTANKWPSTNVTWSLQSHIPAGMDRGRVRRELHDAVNVWASVTNLTFREQRADAQIEVAFKRLAHNDGFDFDGRGNILAHAFFPGDGLGINGDVHFDEDEQWFMLDDGPGAEGGISLFAVAAHEFGHSLGLSHSSVPGALMTPHYQELPRDFQLPEDDMHGIMQIYGIKGRLWDRIKPYTPDARPPDGEPAAPGRPGGRPAPAPPRIAPTTAPPPHSPHSPGRKRPDKPDKPDTCNTAYDTVAVIRREVFIFKDQYLWRIGDRGLEQGYPAEIKRLWGGLPQNLTHVDAVYERSDRKIVFFVGKEYYVYAADKLVPGFPKPLTDLGLPSDLTHIDDAMVWGHNGRTYLFSGSMYWRLDEEIGKIELDYPRDMAMWRGVGYNIDAVAQLNGITYFFKGKGYWKFNDMNMRVEHTIPKPSAPFWMGCPEPKGGWFDWEENSIDIYNDIKSSQFFDYAADDDDDDSAAPQITSTLTVMCLCLSFSSYLSL